MAQNALWRQEFWQKACLHFSYKNILLKYSKNMKWSPKSWHRPFHLLKQADVKEKGKVNQLDVGIKKTNTTVVVTIQGQVKTARTKPHDQNLEHVIIITAHLKQVNSNNKTKWPDVKGFRVGLWLVLVSPCFRENAVATCEIGSFLCSLYYLLGNQISKWRSFEKRGYFDLLFTCFSHQGKIRIYQVWFLFGMIPGVDSYSRQILGKKIRIYQVWFLFGMIPGVDSYSRHFGTINK